MHESRIRNACEREALDDIVGLGGAGNGSDADAQQRGTASGDRRLQFDAGKPGGAQAAGKPFGVVARAKRAGLHELSGYRQR